MVQKSQPRFRLFEGDCIQGMRDKVDPASVDICVTSPPYNLRVQYRSYHDDKDWDQYLDWIEAWAAELKIRLKGDGSLFLNVGGTPSAPLLPFAVIERLVTTKKLFKLQNTIHWIKSIAVPDGESDSERQIGHYKPINSDRFINDCHEYVFHLTPKGNTPLDRKAVGVPYSHKSNIARWSHTNGDDVKCKGNTWFIPYKTIANRAKDRPHPATFPTELAAQCIQLHGKNGSSVVMDTFLGIGHAAFAALECNVAEFIGFEIDKEYIRVAAEELRALGATSLVAQSLQG